MSSSIVSPGSTDVPLQPREAEWLRRAERIAHVGHYLFDFARDHWDSSEALDAIFDLEPSMPRTAKTWQALVHPEDAARVREHLDGTLKGRHRFDFEYRILQHRSKAEVWVHGLGEIERDAQGRPARLFGTIQDITERRRVAQAIADREELLRQSEARYRLIAENAHDVIWTLDYPSRRFTYISPSITTLRGLTVAEAMAERLEDSLTPESLKRVLEKVSKVGTPEEAVTTTDVYDQYCKDGSIKHVEITTRNVKDAQGRPTTAVGVSRDVTARVETERALQHSEARFRAMIEKSSDAILVVGRDGVITFASPAVGTTLQRPLTDFVGHRNDTVVHPDDAAHVRRIHQAFLAGHLPEARAELRLQHADGSWHVADTTVRNLLDDPAVQGIVINARDITAQRELEQQVRHAQKLESIGRLAGGVAHDFNNLLTVILSSLSLVEDDLESGRPLATKDLAAIRTASERARDLTRQLVAFARKQSFAPTTFDLGDAVRSSEKLLRRVLSENVSLVVDVGAGPHPLFADLAQLENVLMNLAVNARDAMNDGGTLTVRVLREPNGWNRLEVEDTGCGMTADVKAKAFEPFFTTKGPHQGTGLGLSMVHGAVSQAGGTIELQSEPGHGTKVVVRFPAGQPATAAPAAAQAQPAERGSETILLVEDDDAVRGVMTRTLETAGYRVLAARSGAEATAVAGHERRPIHLIVADAGLPGQDGAAVASQLRVGRPEAGVVFVSGHSEEVLLEKGVLAEGVHFLPKPFEQAALLREVRRALDERATTARPNAANAAEASRKTAS